MGQWVAWSFAPVFPYSVVHNDGIVDGITDNSEKRGNNGKGYFPVGKGKDTYRNNDVVNKCDNGTYAEPQLKPYPNVDKHEENGIHN